MFTGKVHYHWVTVNIHKNKTDARQKRHEMDKAKRGVVT